MHCYELQRIVFVDNLQANLATTEKLKNMLAARLRRDLSGREGGDKLAINSLIFSVHENMTASFEKSLFGRQISCRSCEYFNNILCCLIATQHLHIIACM